LMESASSKSLAVGGSMVNILSARKSLLFIASK
jgi:hypothetical protein